MTKGSLKNVGQCACGKLRFETIGAPILCVVCHCASCLEAGRRFQERPSAPRVLNTEGGTEFAMFRKDRLRWLEGDSQLRSHRLTPSAGTRRVLAACCDSPIFLEFKGGHWLSVYRDRLGSAAPPIEMRVMTRDRVEGEALGGNVPSYSAHSPSFMWRLFSAWVAMGFRAPQLKPIPEAQRPSSLA